MEYIDYIKAILQKLALPVMVPREAFYIDDEPRRIPDINIIILQMPPELQEEVNLEGSVVHKKKDGVSIFRLPLFKKGFINLKVKEDQVTLVELMVPEF